MTTVTTEAISSQYFWIPCHQHGSHANLWDENNTTTIQYRVWKFCMV